MTSLLLDLAPAAWETYRGARAGGDPDLGARLKRALERLIEDPAALRADPDSRRYRVVEERLREGPPVWGLHVRPAAGPPWIIVWRQMPQVVEVGYIGPAPAPGHG